MHRTPRRGPPIVDFVVPGHKSHTRRRRPVRMRSAGARRRSGAYDTPSTRAAAAERRVCRPTAEEVDKLAKIAAVTHGRDAPGEIEGAPGPATRGQPDRPPAISSSLSADSRQSRHSTAHPPGRPGKTVRKPNGSRRSRLGDRPGGRQAQPGAPAWSGAPPPARCGAALSDAGGAPGGPPKPPGPSRPAAVPPRGARRPRSRGRRRAPAPAAQGPRPGRPRACGWRSRPSRRDPERSRRWSRRPSPRCRAAGPRSKR